MFGSTDNKCLITIVKDFQGEFEDELSVKIGEVVQFVKKLDRYWYEVYRDEKTGKVPVSSCREWNDVTLTPLKIVKSVQAAFVAKYDFVKDCVEGDLRFSASEVLIGLQKLNQDWWHGLRLNSVQMHEDRPIANQKQCGIFPLTHVWPLRDDLLPDSVFSPLGIFVEGATEVNNSSTSDEPPSSQEHRSSSIVHDTTVSLPQTDDCLFYVEVIKTMQSHLSEEMNLPDLGEILKVVSIPDKLYYSGKSLDGTRSGIFPQNFVRKVQYDDEDEQNSNCSSPIPDTPPPSIPPPPAPSTPHITLNFGKRLSVDFVSTPTTGPNGLPLDTPPSYEAAINCEPVSYGYSNQMFNEVESYGRVLFDFDAIDSSELTLRENEIVRLYRHVDEGWMEGEVNGRTGLFPKSYISIIVDCEPAEAVSSQNNDTQTNSTHQVQPIEYPPNTRARILYDFDTNLEQDLRLKAGDIVTLLKHFTSTDWVEAVDSTGNIGFVHLNYCEILNANTHIDSNSTEASNSYANIASTQPLPVMSKTDDKTRTATANTMIELNQDTPKTLNNSLEITNRPQRPAPPAPRRANIFPTFNQFLLNEKHDITQFELGYGSESDNSRQQSDEATNSTNKTASDTQATQRHKRQCVITELIQTERDYCHAMNVCLNVFRSNYEDARLCGVDTDKLFGDMKSVVEVSKSLSKLLDNYANKRPYVDQRVGVCFLDLKFEIKEAYTKYCCNHDSTNKLLRFYEENSKTRGFISRCQSCIQNQTNCFNISSILIKPVQRILKYPLLINELIKCTEESHIDWDPLLMAQQMITDIDISINEHKRRQDLIQKYCKNADTSLSGRFKSLNKHTVMKKSSRLGYRILSTFSFSNPHKDETYDAALQKFTSVEKCIKTFVRGMRDYLHNLEQFYIQSLVVATSVLEYFGDKQEVKELKATHHEMYTKNFAQFRNIIQKQVIETLMKLIDKFKGPLILIGKREDKRIDYEASLKSKCDSELAKNTFEALNRQLIEDLPILTDLSLQLFSTCLQTYMSANKNLICRSAKLFLDLHQLPVIKNSPFGYYQDIEEAFRVKHSLIISQMLRDFSLIHATAFPNVNIPLTDATALNTSSTLSRLHIHNRCNNTWKHSLPAKKLTPTGVDNRIESATIEKKKQTDTQKRDLESRFKPNELYQLTVTHEPCDLYELYAEAEDLVGVIKRKHPTGLDHLWYVDRGGECGFLPQTILSPYWKRGELLQSSQTMEPSNTTMVTSLASELLMPSANSEQMDLLSDLPRYDMVPDESFTSFSSNQSSLLSFDELDNHQPTSIETKNPLFDITSEFDPLAACTSKSNELNLFGKGGTSSSSTSSMNSNNSSWQTSKNRYQAAYPFKAGDNNQLSLRLGEQVYVQQKCDLQGNSQWWLVTNSTGQKGYVPANYLQQEHNQN